MRIAYLTWQRVDRRDGVVEKIASQIRHWRGQNHQVRLFGMSRSKSIWSGARDIPHRLIPSGNLLQRHQRARNLARCVRDWGPDVIFFRMAAYYPALGQLMNAIPTIVDVNTNDLIEMRRELPAWLFAYYRHFRKRILRRAAGVTAVTPELAAAIDSDIPVTVVTNGIDLDQYSVLPLSREKTPRLFFLGSAGRCWHGVDKILQLAEQRREWIFEIVGPSADDLGNGLPGNVRPHGLLSLEAYRPIMARCHAAIASLAMYENDLHQACPLKVRQYLALGLPVITGYEEADFLGGAPFLLRLPNSPNNVARGLDRIDEFVDRCGGHRVPRSEVEHLRLEDKEAARLEFFARAARTSR